MKQNSTSYGVGRGRGAAAAAVRPPAAYVLPLPALLLLVAGWWGRAALPPRPAAGWRPLLASACRASRSESMKMADLTPDTVVNLDSQL
jgi:hypothetical protein